MYLSRFSTTGLRRGTLILIPKGAVIENGEPLPTMRDHAFGSRGEFDQVMRVENLRKEVGEKSQMLEEQEDDNENLLWWKDSDMAQRLAKKLRPQIEEPEDGDDEQPYGKVIQVSSICVAPAKFGSDTEFTEYNPDTFYADTTTRTSANQQNIVLGSSK